MKEICGFHTYIYVINFCNVVLKKNLILELIPFFKCSCLKWYQYKLLWFFWASGSFWGTSVFNVFIITNTSLLMLVVQSETIQWKMTQLAFIILFASCLWKSVEDTIALDRHWEAIIYEVYYQFFSEWYLGEHW